MHRRGWRRPPAGRAVAVRAYSRMQALQLMPGGAVGRMLVAIEALGDGQQCIAGRGVA